MKVRSPNLHDEGHLRAHYPLPDKLRVHDHEAMDGDAVWQHALGRGADSHAVRGLHQLSTRRGIRGGGRPGRAAINMCCSGKKKRRLSMVRR
jgi:hypothetical protein